MCRRLLVASLLDHVAWPLRPLDACRRMKQREVDIRWGRTVFRLAITAIRIYRSANGTADGPPPQLVRLQNSTCDLQLATWTHDGNKPET